MLHTDVIKVLEEEILTEENTDKLIDIVLALIKLPIWLRWLPLRSILDRLLPNVLLDALKLL